MIRGLGLSLSFLLIAAVPALAQSRSHGPGHVRPDGPHHPHGPGHIRPGSAEHAATHSLLLGTWKGTFSPSQGIASGLNLSVSRDTDRKLTLRMSADQILRAGPVSGVTINGDKLHWTQELAGASCKASAVVSGATPSAPQTMQGNIACEEREITFTLHKTAE